MIDLKVLPSERLSIIEHAIHALSMSNPSNPPNLRFGAAVLTSDRQVFSSSAFWSDTLSLCLHAEQAALAHANAHGQREILAIACVSTEDLDGERITCPCGMCKQLLFESYRSSGIDIEVVMASLKGRFEAKLISELTPFPWPSVPNPQQC